MSERTAVLLINLGMPAAPEPGAVRRYLREFLSDPRVLDMPALGRWLLLEAVILPTRPRRSAEAYAKIWTETGSPLLVHGRALEAALARELGDACNVALGMRYGEPSIKSALASLLETAPNVLMVVPLFPQYADASTGSALAAVFGALGSEAPTVRTIDAFYDAPGFIDAVAHVARPVLADFDPDHVLLSYHGLPERQIRKLDASGSHCFERDDCCDSIGHANRQCYRAHCFATSRALIAALGLDPQHTSTGFQSRLGRTPWIKPYTDVLLDRLAQQGVRRLAVLCPSFVADCLETLEEIGLRGREQWIAAGGEDLRLVPCVNADPTWVTALAALVREPEAG